jgi:hypothetical protein
MLKTDILLLNLNEREKAHIHIYMQRVQTSKKAFVAIEDLNWHMQDEESIYNCAVVRVDLSSQQ